MLPTSTALLLCSYSMPSMQQIKASIIEPQSHEPRSLPHGHGHSPCHRPGHRRWPRAFCSQGSAHFRAYPKSSRFSYGLNVSAGRGTAHRIPRICCSYQALQDCTVQQAANGARKPILSLWNAEPTKTCVILFMTHFADLSSWELAQKVKKVIPDLEARGVKVIAVGLGGLHQARRFAEVLQFPLDNLYADETGQCYKALGFSPGFAPEAGVSPYLKLLPMLAGIGSPGTIQEVLRGYVGDRSAKPVFEGRTPFNVLGGGYQRPFELATLRLSNMIGILPKWGQLCPENEELLTQQGGCLVFRGEDVIFRHDDSGILKYTDVDALIAACNRTVSR